MFNESNEVRNHWKEYVEELYRSDDGKTHANQGVEEEIPRNKEDNGPEVLGEEEIAAITKLKNKNAQGIDNIPAEMLKSLAEETLTELT